LGEDSEIGETIMIKISRRIQTVALVMATFPLIASAQPSQAGDPCFASGVPFTGKSLTISNTAQSFAAADYNLLTAGTGMFNATALLLCVNTEAINIRMDSTAPTASVGIPLAANGCVCIGQISIPRTQMIRSGSSDSVVFGTFIAPSN
jgi:hypothetical protein